MFNNDPLKDSGKNTKITIPKAPAPSTISSPSAVPATPQSTPTDTGVKSSPANAPAGPGIDKAPAGIDINSTLTYQSNLLAEILEGTKSLVSVNKDILRYTRNQT
jgi:transcription initiation factor TFIID subunit TAF12